MAGDLQYRVYIKQLVTVTKSGVGKNFKSKTNIPHVPDDFIRFMGVRFWPRDIKVYKEKDSYSFIFDVDGKAKKITCTKENAMTRYNSEVKPHINLSNDDVYQRMIASYIDHIDPSLRLYSIDSVKTVVEKTDAKKVAIKKSNNKAKFLRDSVFDPVAATFTKEQKAITRRNVPAEIVIQIIKFKRDKENQDMSNSDIAGRFEITKDKVVNYYSGKTKLYQSEFKSEVDGVTYDEYLAMLH